MMRGICVMDLTSLVATFEWTPLAAGWYLFLWGDNTGFFSRSLSLQCPELCMAFTDNPPIGWYSNPPIPQIIAFWVMIWRD